MKIKYIPSKFESKWSKKWQEQNLYRTPELPKPDKKKYILDMFPYPSGAGLHVGHTEGYTATDIISRFNRMNGFDVLHPMGWDAFGLPAENYAIKTNVHPQKTTDEAIGNFKSQVCSAGLSYDWDRELGTHRSEYYKWTQWLFLQLYKKGLAYRKEAMVNWDPIDQTVLANEQVLADGTAERSGALVEQKMLTQWFFRITSYADRLLEDLEKLDWPESTKAGQRNWIGKSTGINIDYPVKEIHSSITVFTTRPDTNFGATFIVVAPESEFITKHLSSFPNKGEVAKYVEATTHKTELQRLSEGKKKTGVFTGLYAHNRLNNKQLPIYVGDFVLATVGTGAVVGVPGHDKRDFEFAQTLGIKIIRVVKTADGDTSEITHIDQVQEEEGTMINSDFLNGMDIHNAKENIMDHMEKEGWGKRVVNYRLRDWLISRQRFWGAPIPVLYDADDNPIPLNENDLPVTLPMDVEFKPTGQSPLHDHTVFQKIDKEKYPQAIRREADTMDTFVDSSWYFFRFCDPQNDTAFSSPEKMKAWGPVDLYMGGAEHTVLHLLYSRFITKFLFDEGYINFDEPFQCLRHQGMILGPDHQKMSKRLGNVISPTEVIEEYGADTLRMYEMFMGPIDQMKSWNVNSVQGVYRFLQRVWNIYNQPEYITKEPEKEHPSVVSKLMKTVIKVTDDIPELKFNTAIASMMEFMNEWEAKDESGNPRPISIEHSKEFLQILAPFAPFITEELWSKMGEEFSIHQTAWPTADVSLVEHEGLPIAIQVNGKTRGVIFVRKTITKEDAITKAKQEPNVVRFLEGKEIKKEIYVPGKIVNFVVV